MIAVIDFLIHRVVYTQLRDAGMQVIKKAVG